MNAEPGSGPLRGFDDRIYSEDKHGWGPGDFYALWQNFNRLA